MSAKWRAIQHRHRYTYNAVVFPPSFIDSLNQSSLSASSPTFYTELQHLISLNSTYSQVNHVKKVASSFNKLLVKEGEKNEGLVSTAAAFYLEVFFLENSMPLHRTLLSVVSKTKDVFQPVIGECFRVLCNEYGRMTNKRNRFSVSRVVLSVMGMPKLGFLVDVIEECAVLVCWDIVLGLKSVVLETEEWARPSPIVLEQCQEALSCLYYLFQKFPGKFKDLDTEDSNVMEMALGVLISVLKSVAFSRDCFVAAGVSFFAALQVCLSDQELGLFIIEVIFDQIVSNSGTNSEGSFSNVISKVPYKGDVCLDIRNLSVLNRLCLIRGILTAVPRMVLNTNFVVSREIFNDFEFVGNIVSSLKTILYDGILPELCNYCENPTDSHFNFHALTVMQICLQQIKTSMLANLTNASEEYNPLPEDMGTRMLRIIWNNLEDPLSQTVKQVHLIFDLFLDIQSLLCGTEGSEKIKSFLRMIASGLLHLGSRCKGRYVPLALLTKRFGAKTMLDMSPDLLFEIVQAYTDDDVCCAATSFLKCFLEYLRDECWSSDGVERGYALYRGHYLPPFLHGLASGISKLRSNLNTYALPVLLEVDVDGIFPLLACISIGPSGVENERLYSELDCTDVELQVEQKVAVLVSLLKVSRSLALIEGDIDFCDDSKTSDTDDMLESKSFNLYALICIKGIKVRILVGWLVLALTHIDESLRVDAAESLFLNPKTSSLPSHLELSLMKKAVPLNMRSSSTGFQMKWSSLFRKFFSRVRTALERQVKQGSWQPRVNHENNELCLSKGTEESVVSRAQELFNFMRWLSCFLFFSCYPSAPYKRKIMAMELILIMINIWSVIPSSQESSASISPESCLYPYSVGITSPDSTFLLVGSIIDSWDRLRESSFRILLHFPTPLPGISNEGMVQKVITWAKKLVCSPRVRESDAGALTLRLIFRKYVLDLGWRVRASANVVCCHSQYTLLNGDFLQCASAHPVIEYVQSLIHWLDVAVEEGEKDLAEACKNSFVHGVLLTLRYTFEELDWNSDAVLSGTSEMRLALEKLLELVVRITSLALWVVSADAWHLPEDMDEMADGDAFLLDGPDEMDVPVPSTEQEDKSSKSIRDARPSDQIVMVGCWLAMKELSLLLGTIIRKIPLPSHSCSGSLECGHPCSDSIDASVTATGGMLDLNQLEKIGNHFMEVLLKMKHNGAIDKTRAGFTALCNRLLCSNDPMLCKLTESWMEQLMERTIAKGQTVDDLLRRSAGIPAAFTAFFLSEPEGAPKKLLPRALRWLIDVANGSLLSPSEANATSISCQISSTKSGQETDSALIPEMIATDKTSKIRDEGVVATVHTFNILRAAFNDTNLASDTSGFAAEALVVSIRSFSSPYWEVRNSACLAYTSLVRRMIGFHNVHKRESARRALTGLEFFHRYPSLHPFLSNELKVATEFFGDALSGQSESNLAKVVHPSLCPMLILLSRLKPSTIASETGDDLDPFLFMPFIRKCSTQSNLQVRVLASRALTGLVSNEKLPTVLLDISVELSHLENQITAGSAAPISLHPANGAHHASFNLIHGLLLQLSSLLDINCRNLADFSRKDQILDDLMKVLAMRSWIASPKKCPCPILNYSFLQVLDHMLSVASSCHMSTNLFAIRNLLLELSTECLDVEASYGLPFYDPTIAELRQQAAASYFCCLFQTSDEVGEEVFQIPQRSPPDSMLLQIPEVENSGFLERLVRSLSDLSYEVRLVTLKWLLKFLKSSESGSEINYLSSSQTRIIKNWNKANLQATLMKLLEVEKNHRCTYYILKIIFTWNFLKFQELCQEKSDETLYVGALDCDSVFQLWDRLISMYKLTRHAKTRETLVCCLAICVKHFARLFSSFILTDKGQKTTKCNESDQTDRSACFCECITFFLKVIKQHSSSSEPVNMRRAATESILASGLLEQAEVIASSVFNQQVSSKNSFSYFELQNAVDKYAHQILEMWFTCIKLLEDEDDGIRLRLATDIQKCLSPRSSGTKSDTCGAPTQVEKVIELSFDHLSSIFGHWIVYFDYLLRWVLDAANYVISKGDLVRRVFDKEIDNHHEEKLLISQICCSHLEKLPITKSWEGELLNKEEVMNYLLDWRMRFYHQLMSFAKDHIGKLGVDWIGGVGNHKDAFLPIYANLLGFYVLSNCIFNLEAKDGMPLLSDIVELGNAIDPFLRNPLISNLYLLIVRSHEKKFSTTTDCLNTRFRDDSWYDFDPYFLLG
ncbi:PREDICTED: thyroid adenoma-associated protein homolog [Theobroma cacao]|uniref:Thyroid adenoma-associated protein homolog n=1 Tax=Theobroma cacao TaxID=3641 RepID=A0AB32W7S0_THECC|nr:PREDICTED: thyroid adenoma-associated protein homolog [Theobroma cacao]